MREPWLQRDKDGRIDLDSSGFEDTGKGPLLVKWFWGQWPDAPWKRRRLWHRFWKRIQVWASRRGYYRLVLFTRRFVRWR